MSVFSFPEGTSKILKKDCFEALRASSIILPDSVLEIGPRAFSGWYPQFEHFTFGSSLTSVGEEAFYYCIIKHLHINDLSRWCAIKWATNFSHPLVEHLHVNDIEITDLVLPDNVSVINDYAFIMFRNIVSVVIPDSVTRIGNQAFYECFRLENLTIGEGVTEIGEEAFSKCGLKRVTILSQAAVLGKGVFKECDSLRMIVVPHGTLKHYKKFIRGKAQQTIVEAPE